MALRRSLAQRGGRITQAGDAEWSAHLAASLAAADGGATDDLTHGFHAYPARMHPVLARELLARFSEPGQLVLDPFAGSGTVLIEAMVAGCRAQGVDLSPLASRVAEQQCALRDAKARSRFAAVVRSIAEESEARVRSRAPVDVPIPRSEREFYQPHVMLELSGLWDEIQKVPAAEMRRALEVVFSALLVKFSKQRADTADDETPKRIRKGLVTEFFARKSDELVMRWEALWDAVPDHSHAARFVQGDARQLSELLGERFRADLVLTSPPYGGTYDYADHHARRSAWLKLDVTALRTHEIGARRNLSAPRESQRARDAREAEAAAYKRGARGGGSGGGERLGPAGVREAGSAEDASRESGADASGARGRGRTSASGARATAGASGASDRENAAEALAKRAGSRGGGAARDDAGAPRRDKHAERRERRREPVARWDRELTQVLRSIRGVLRPESSVIMWLGDAELGGQRVEADEQLARIAPEADLELVASAAQERTDMRGGPPRREHLLLLRGR